jgi:hypothetical protein
MNIAHPFWIVIAFDDYWRPLYTVGPFEEEGQAEAYATRRVNDGDAPAMTHLKVVSPEEPVAHIHLFRNSNAARRLQ